MNKEIAAYILGWRYQLKCQGIAKSKWRKRIGDKFIDSGESKKYEHGVEEFCSTWYELNTKGLI